MRLFILLPFLLIACVNREAPAVSPQEIGNLNTVCTTQGYQYGSASYFACAQRNPEPPRSAKSPRS